MIALLKGVEEDLIKLFMCLQVPASKVIVKKHKIASCYKLKLTPLTRGGTEPAIFGVLGRTAPRAPPLLGLKDCVPSGGRGRSCCAEHRAPMMRPVVLLSAIGTQALSARACGWEASLDACPSPSPPSGPATFLGP